ncbi:MAG: carbonic anhydrase [Isosphaeraceae bacterium]
MDIIYRYDRYAAILPKPIADADGAIQALLEGHARYRRIVQRVEEDLVRDGEPSEPLVIPSSPLSLNFSAVGAPPQVPFAVALGCSDARAPIERIFDQPPNALFVVRVAGNVLGTECLGSIDYAVHQLKDSLRLLVVLGHSGCGAVTAAVDSYLSPDDYPEVGFGHSLRSLVDRIQMAVRGAAKALGRAEGGSPKGKPGYRDALIETAIYLNAALTAFDVRREIEASGAKGVRVVYGVFDIADQRVHALPHHCSDTEEPVFGDVPLRSEDFAALGERIVRAVRDRGLL